MSSAESSWTSCDRSTLDGDFIPETDPGSTTSSNMASEPDFDLGFDDDDQDCVENFYADDGNDDVFNAVDDQDEGNAAGTSTGQGFQPRVSGASMGRGRGGPADRGGTCRGDRAGQGVRNDQRSRHPTGSLYPDHNLNQLDPDSVRLPSLRSSILRH
eukprot:GFUD01024198.1.p1 GENE.GFUD01024198.1~~GFUD01024198.1.p1  ORF type:complete len:157 (-),score=26.48 GFUD01024198.1:229-699(-)